MDRRMLVIAGIVAAALAAAGCGDDPTDTAAQAAPKDEIEVTNTPRAQGTDRSDAAQGGNDAKDKTLYFNRSDASQR